VRKHNSYRVGSYYGLEYRILFEYSMRLLSVFALRTDVLWLFRNLAPQARKERCETEVWVGCYLLSHCVR
jgi:hypothetical protein